MRKNIFEIGKFFPLNEKFKWETRDIDSRTYQKCSFEGEVRILLDRNSHDSRMVLKYKKASGSNIAEVTNVNEAFVDQFIAQFAPDATIEEDALQKAIETFATLLKARSYAIQQRSEGMVVIPNGSDSLLKLNFVERKDYNIDTFKKYRDIPENKGCIIVNEELLIFPASVIAKPPTVKASVRGCDYLAKLKAEWDNNNIDYSDGVKNAASYWTKECIYKVFGVSVEDNTYTEDMSLVHNDICTASVQLSYNEKDGIVETLPVLDSAPVPEQEPIHAQKEVYTATTAPERRGRIDPDRMPGVSVYTVVDGVPVFAEITHYVYTRTLSSDSVWLMADGKLVKKGLSEVFTTKTELSQWFSTATRELPNQELVRI